MHSTLRVRLAATTLLLLAACRSTSSASAPDDLAANRALNQQFAAHLRARDWDAISRLYAEDAVLMPPNMPPVHGRAAIRDHLAAFPPLEKFSLVDAAVEVRGDLAYGRGRYEMTLALPGSPTDEGYYIEIRKRQPDGAWRYVAEIYNSSAALPPGN